MLACGSDDIHAKAPFCQLAKRLKTFAKKSVPTPAAIDNSMAKVQTIIRLRLKKRGGEAALRLKK